MSEAMHSFLVSVSFIVAVALLIPGVELVARRLRREAVLSEQREVIQLTPARPRRRSIF